MLALFVLAGIADTVTAGGLDEDSWIVTLLGIAIIATLFALVVALGLGIAGICVSGVKKLFAILGTTFSAVTIILTIVLIVIGLIMEG